MATESNTIFEDITCKAQAITEIIGSSLVQKQDGTPRVPEVVDAYNVAMAEPNMVWRLFYAYLYQIQQLISLNDADLEIIKAALSIREQKKEKKQSSASHVTILDFFNETSSEQRAYINNLIIELSDSSSPIFNEAINVLTTMMQGGHAMKEEGLTPQDGDERSNNVIWGHTQLKDPYYLIEFTICHFLERFMTVALQQMGLEIANQKDWFLNILTDVITYNSVRGGKHTGHIAHTWSHPRRYGGLGWIKEDRTEAFQQASSPNQET